LFYFRSFGQTFLNFSVKINVAFLLGKAQKGRISDPDPHWITTFGNPASGSAFEMQIRINVLYFSLKLKNSN
jgi:hypothetical protein